MKKYNIKEVASITKISADTLRYYDSIKLISPNRSTNNYRNYNENDILLLKYLRVMKYAGFSLDEIKLFIINIGINDLSLCNESIMPLWDKKKRETITKINDLQKVVKLMEIAEQAMAKKINTSNDIMQELVIEVFESIINYEDGL